jgi:hypothetical protein
MKIKINIRKKSTSTDNYWPLNTELDHPDNLDIFYLFTICRYHKVIVRGDARALCKTLKKKLYGHIYKTTPSEIVYKSYSKYFFWKIGNGHLLTKSLNICDFYSSVPIQDIPIFFLICTESNNKIHAFDIRSLYAYKCINPDNFRNPYTDKEFTSRTLNQIDTKIHWLKKFKFPLQYTNTCKNIDKMSQYIINVFAHISTYQYVDHEWFQSLNFDMLKKLYYELFEIWHIRLPMQDAYKTDMVKDGSVFSNWSKVERYTPSMHNKLIIETLENIERLVTEGITEDHRKSGCSIFLMGLVLVSEDAATSHPHLYQAAYME